MFQIKMFQIKMKKFLEIIFKLPFGSEFPRKFIYQYSTENWKINK